MKPRTTWILLTLVIAGLAWILFLEDALLNRDRSGGDPSSGRRILAISPGDVRSVTIAVRDQDAVVAERHEDDGWRITSPMDALADAAVYDGILTQLTSLERDTDADPDADPSAFGLTAPIVSCRLRGKGLDVEVAIGNETPLRGRRYLRVDRGPVEVVDEGIREVLSRSIHDLRDTDVFTADPFDADSFELWRGESRDVFARRIGSSDSFEIGDPPFDLADRFRIREILYRLSGLDAASFEAKSAEDPTAIGLAPVPRLRLRVGIEGESSEGLAIGDPDPNTPGTRWAFAERFPDELIRIPEDLLRDLEGEASSFRAKELVDLGGRQVTGLRFGSGDDSVHLEKRQRGWWLTRPIEIAAEGPAVDALIDALGKVPIRRFLGTSPGDPSRYGLTPGRRIEVDTTDGPIAFFAGGLDEEQRHLYVRRTEDGPALAVDAGAIELLPTTARDLRTRDITRIDLWERIELRLARPDREYFVTSESLDFTLVEPFEGSLDGRVAQGLERLLAPLRAEKIVDEVADDVSRYGLDAPSTTLRAKIFPTTRAAYEVELALGGRDADGHRFARIGGEPLVFTIAPELAQLLEGEWLERRLVDAETDAVTRIRITRRGKTTHLLRRGGAFALIEPEGATLDANETEALAARLGQLTVERFLTEDEGKGALREADVVRFEVERDAGVDEWRLEVGGDDRDGSRVARLTTPAGDESTFLLTAEAASAIVEAPILEP